MQQAPAPTHRAKAARPQLPVGAIPPLANDNLCGGRGAAHWCGVPPQQSARRGQHPLRPLTPSQHPLRPLTPSHAPSAGICQSDSMLASSFSPKRGCSPLLLPVAVLECVSAPESCTDRSSGTSPELSGTSPMGAGACGGAACCGAAEGEWVRHACLPSASPAPSSGAAYLSRAAPQAAPAARAAVHLGRSGAAKCTHWHEVTRVGRRAIVRTLCAGKGARVASLMVLGARGGGGGLQCLGQQSRAGQKQPAREPCRPPL